MEQTEFNEVVIFLQGAYGRVFPENVVTVAWGLLQRYPGPVVQQAAIQMIEENEEYFVPMKWLQRAKMIQREAREEQTARKMRDESAKFLSPPRAQRRAVAQLRRPNETDEQRIAYLKDLIGTNADDGTAGQLNCMEYIHLVLVKPYPPRHILSGIRVPALAGPPDPEPEYPDP